PKQGKMSKHIQIESNMTLSGANADKRIPLTVTEQKYALLSIYNAITGAGVNAPAIANKAYADAVANAAAQVKAAGSKGVVVTGLDDINAQLLVIAINNALQSAAFNPSGARL